MKKPLLSSLKLSSFLKKKRPECFLALTLGFSLMTWGAWCASKPVALPSLPSQWTGSATHALVFGDSGSGLPAQYKLAAQMNAVYRQSPFHLALMLGDNIYPVGDIQHLGQQRFLTPYQFLLAQGVRFYPVLGNHDVMGGYAQAQIKFFGMPARYYRFQTPYTDFFALDTVRFDAVQQQWLRQQLASSKARWKVVYGHYPIFSSGEHGTSRVLEKSLKPLLERYRVTLYLAGHDHNYERFTPKNGVLYLVSGGGGASLRGFNTPISGSVVRISAYHFLTLHANAQQFSIKAYNLQGRVFDQVRVNQLSVSKTGTLGR